MGEEHLGRSAELSGAVAANKKRGLWPRFLLAIPDRHPWSDIYGGGHLYAGIPLRLESMSQAFIFCMNSHKSSDDGFRKFVRVLQCVAFSGLVCLAITSDTRSAGPQLSKTEHWTTR